MKKIAIITGITILWCAVLVGAAVGLVFGWLSVSPKPGNMLPNYIGAGILAGVAVLAFFHLLPGMILSGLLSAWTLYASIAQFIRFGSTGVWPGVAIGTAGLLYVWNWFHKRKVLKAMAKERA